MGIEYPELNTELSFDDLQWGKQIRIIRNNDRSLDRLVKGITKQMRGKVHIRAFFFRQVYSQLFSAIGKWFPRNRGTGNVFPVPLLRFFDDRAIMPW